jgi:Mg-chelatase subunit ChlD
MNSDFSKLSPEERDARITALLLGELAADEANELLTAVASDAELARAFERRKQTIALLGVMLADEADMPADAPTRLTDKRREKLLNSFKTSAQPRPQRLREFLRRAKTFAPLAAAAIAILSLIATTMLPSLAKAKARARRVTPLPAASVADFDEGRGRVALLKAQPAEPALRPESGEEHSKSLALLSAPNVSSTSGRGSTISLNDSMYIIADSDANGPASGRALNRQLAGNVVLPSAGDVTLNYEKSKGESARAGQGGDFSVNVPSVDSSSTIANPTPPRAVASKPAPKLALPDNAQLGDRSADGANYAGVSIAPQSRSIANAETATQEKVDEYRQDLAAGRRYVDQLGTKEMSSKGILTKPDAQWHSQTTIQDPRGMAPLEGAAAAKDGGANIALSVQNGQGITTTSDFAIQGRFMNSVEDKRDRGFFDQNRNSELGTVNSSGGVAFITESTPAQTPRPVQVDGLKDSGGPLLIGGLVTDIPVNGIASLPTNSKVFLQHIETDGAALSLYAKNAPAAANDRWAMAPEPSDQPVNAYAFGSSRAEFAGGGSGRARSNGRFGNNVALPNVATESDGDGVARVEDRERRSGVTDTGTVTATPLSREDVMARIEAQRQVLSGKDQNVPGGMSRILRAPIEREVGQKAAKVEGKAAEETEVLRKAVEEAGVKGDGLARKEAEAHLEKYRSPELTPAPSASQSSRGEPDAPKRPATPPPVPQPEVLTRDNAFSTFSLNVADVSFKLAAASLEKGAMPDAASIRSEEFLNAFDYRDPQPAPGVPVAFSWERAQYPFAQNRDVLRFSVKTAAAGRDGGRPLNIVLALDSSGSMERADRVQIVREALRTLAAQLQPQDKLSIVTFTRTARLWVDGVSGTNASAAVQRVSEITPEGGTNLEDAMDLAYRTALRHYAANAINRVVLLTDGAANLGDVTPANLKTKVEAHRKQGIAFDCFGIGWEGFNDDLLEQLSRNGDGRYGFVNSPEEAGTEFAGQLAGALRVAASDVKVQVEFNPKRVNAFRQIGYAKHQLTKEQFRDNTVDAAEIGASEAGNGLYIIETNPRGEGPIATVRARFRIPGTSDYREHEWVVPFAPTATPIEQSSAAMKLAVSSAAFSEMLASNPFAAEVTSDRLLKILSGVPETFGVDPRPKKLEWMIRQAKSISGR